jgi:pimeloyl-ACP methyl ester carboxylesterase
VTAYVVLPGSGSAGLVWERAAAELGEATILPLPDEPDVASIVAALEPEVGRAGERPVLVGSSLGAMVALALARSVRPRALVLIAAGFGIEVHPSVLARIAADPPGLIASMARGVVADPRDSAIVEVVERDFSARGQPVLLRHMQALAAHRPDLPPDLPPTLVLWGTRDPGVPLDAHAELAMRCSGALVPIAGAGHLPYLERPEDTVAWIRVARDLN